MTEKHFADKAIADCHKNAKFAKVFSLESFRLYTVYGIGKCALIILVPGFDQLLPQFKYA